MTKLTLALVGDIHHGTFLGTKLGQEALPLLGRFGTFVRALKPDAVVDMGDRTSEESGKTPQALMEEVGVVFRDKIPGKVFHLLGNHDLDGLTQADNEKALGKPLGSVSADINGFHLVFWNTNPVLDLEKGFTLDASALEWLKKDLQAAALPTVLFTHLPLDNGSMKGNYYFEKVNPHHAGYSENEGEVIRDVIERSGKVILCVNGHAHWNAYHGIDGIHYVTIPSLIDSFTSWPDANAAWARLSIDETIEIEISGRTPMSYRLPIKKMGAHWANIDKDYAPKAPKTLIRYKRYQS